MSINAAIAKAVRMMDIITYYDEIENLPDSGFMPDLDYFLASTQVRTSRFDSDPEKGLFLAAKGGHNHNDV